MAPKIRPTRHRTVENKDHVCLMPILKSKFNHRLPTQGIMVLPWRSLFWMEGLSDEAYYPWDWDSPKKIRLKSVNLTFVNEQKNVLIYQ